MMRNQWGILAALALGLFSLAWWGLPSVVPAPPVATQLPVTARRQANPRENSQSPAIVYGLFLPRLARYAHDIPMHIVAPVQAWPGTVLEECYRQGNVVTLYYNTALLLESPQPIATDEAPSASTGVTLANGTPALWEWFPGEAGSAYRLVFQQAGTYVELMLFGSRSTSLSAAQYLANQCQLVSGS